MKIYLIKNLDTGEYWSNEIGWVESPYDADGFDKYEKNEFHLPIGGTLVLDGDFDDFGFGEHAFHVEE